MASDGDAPGVGRICVALASAAVAPGVDDPDALLALFHAQTGWAKAVAGAGARVVVVQRFGRDAALRRDGVDYRFVADRGHTPTSRWFWGARMAAALAAVAPDVVHVQGMASPLLVRNFRLSLSSRTTVVVQDHGGVHERSPEFGRWYWRMFYGAGLRAADAVLFTARELAAPWLASGVLAPEQLVREIPEASTDLHDQHTAATATTPQASRLPGRPALLWVGRLDGNKDPLTILAGFERAVATLPDAALTFVFSGDELLPALRARIASSATLRSRVHLRGRVERSALPALYAGADAFVLGSHHEAASFALIEALAFGLTPVVSDIPAFRALTDAGRLGALFPPGDAGAFAGALAALAAPAPADAAARRERVRAYFDRELSWRALGAKALAIYRGLLSQRLATRR